jgi:hypothetical protein
MAEYFANFQKNSGGISANSGPEFRLLGTSKKSKSIQNRISKIIVSIEN